MNMNKKIALIIGIAANGDIITGGERQHVEMIKGIERNGIDIQFLSDGEVLQKIPNIINKYHKENIYIINDYSKRFSLLKINYICRIKYGVNVVCTVGAFYFDYRKSKLKNAVDYIVSYLYLLPASLIFTTGKAVENKLINMGLRKKRIVNIYPAIRETLIREALRSDICEADDDRKIILTVGRFHPVKGYDYLLDAVKLCGNLKDVYFVLVGDYERIPNDYYKHIKQRIENEGLGDRITIYGKTNNDVELAALYRNCWCYLHTSVWETSPITVCEPLLFGKPVIATEVGGTAEYLKNGSDSLLVAPKSGYTIADAIKRIYQDQIFYNRLKNTAFTSGKKYMKRRWYDVGEEYYTTIIDNNKNCEEQ